MSHFDQQPIEATALLLAAEAALTVTGGARYAAAMERCFAWSRRQRPRPLRGGSRARRVLRWPHPTGVNVNESGVDADVAYRSRAHPGVPRCPAPIPTRAELLATSAR